MPPGTILRMGTVFFFVAALFSCGSIVAGPDSKTVGAPCAADSDCATRCLTNDGHFPGGMCTVPCAASADCPSGSTCLTEEGGVCVTACRADADCAGFGRGFVCDRESAGTGTTVSVCRVP
jgi:hypothetical protein